MRPYYVRIGRVDCQSGLRLAAVGAKLMAQNLLGFCYSKGWSPYVRDLNYRDLVAFSVFSFSVVFVLLYCFDGIDALRWTKAT